MQEMKLYILVKPDIIEEDMPARMIVLQKLQDSPSCFISVSERTQWTQSRRRRDRSKESSESFLADCHVNHSQKRRKSL